MQVGISGHRARTGIDWNWIEQTLRVELARLQHVDAALSSLATGSDQVFARVAISLGIPLVTVIPIQNYERYFEGIDRQEYDRLLSLSSVKDIGWRGDDESGFLAAGKYIVERTDLLFAVWDGEKSRGRGGTADIVEYARDRSKRIIHLDPIALSVRAIAGGRNR
jgi:hypothetical protein